VTSVLSLVLVWGGGSGAPHQTQASSKLNLSVALEDVLTRPPIPLAFILMFAQSGGFCRAPLRGANGALAYRTGIAVLVPIKV